MLHLIYHPQVLEVLRALHPNVNEALINAVVASRANQAMQPPTEALPAEDVAPSCIRFLIPLFRETGLVAFYLEYLETPVVFYAYQSVRKLAEQDDSVVDAAQNALYDCQVSVEMSKPPKA